MRVSGDTSGDKCCGIKVTLSCRLFGTRSFVTIYLAFAKLISLTILRHVLKIPNKVAGLSRKGEAMKLPSETRKI